MAFVGLNFKFPEWARKIKRYENEINLFIAATVQTNRGMMFDAEGAANGHKKWKKWSPNYAKRQAKRGRSMILSDTGTLRRSLAPKNITGKAGPNGIVRFGKSGITVGTEVAYAVYVNDVRPFDSWNKTDKEELTVALRNKLIQVLNR